MKLYIYPPTPISVSVPPIAFTIDGMPTPVNIDTADASNSRALPSQIYIDKDGEFVAVAKSSVDPAMTVAIPVEIVGVNGTEINITAGDINVQLTDLGVNADRVRVGDGSGNYLGITSNSEAKVNDADAIAKLTSLDNKSPALVSGKVPVDTGHSQPLTDTQLRAVPVPISGSVTTGGLTDAQIRATPLPVSGPLTDAQLRALAVTVSGPLTDAQLRASAVDVESNQLPVSLGQKTAPNSLSVVLASGSALATEAKQDDSITQATSTNTKLDTLNTAISGFSGKSAGALVPFAFNEIVITYVGATEDLNTVVYKLASSTVATLTFSYDGSNRLSQVVRS